MGGATGSRHESRGAEVQCCAITGRGAGAGPPSQQRYKLRFLILFHTVAVQRGESECGKNRRPFFSPSTSLPPLLKRYCGCLHRQARTNLETSTVEGCPLLGEIHCVISLSSVTQPDDRVHYRRVCSLRLPCTKQEGVSTSRVAVQGQWVG